MKKLLLTSAIILAAGAAQASIAPYASIKAGFATGGFNQYYNEPSYVEGYGGFTGFTGAIAGGAAFAVDDLVTVRGELEYAYSKIAGNPNLNGWEVSLTGNTIMLNVYADFGATSWSVRPYVGLGAGFGFGNKLKEAWYGSTTWTEDMDGGFAYAGMIGAAYYINSNFALDLGFKYAVVNADFKSSGGWYYGEDGTNIINRTVTLGARYTF